jgi:hypothetical protein
MRKIRLSSVLPPSSRDELEHIVFFNPEQNLVTAPLLSSVHRYGVPSILEKDGCLRFCVKAFGLLQTLYALDESEDGTRLAGVAMFTRPRRSSIVIIHLAVHEDYTAKGRWASASVLGHLLAAIRLAGLCTRGVRTLRIPYPHEVDLRLRAREPTRSAISPKAQ